ncbi:hypothetical protein Tco_0551414 [Tanacetum coccineum]
MISASLDKLRHSVQLEALLKIEPCVSTTRTEVPSSPAHEAGVNESNGKQSRYALLSNKERLLLRKQALKMRKRPVLAVGASTTQDSNQSSMKQNRSDYEGIIKPIISSKLISAIRLECGLQDNKVQESDGSHSRDNKEIKGSIRKSTLVKDFALTGILSLHAKCTELVKHLVIGNENNYPKVVKVLQDVLEIVTNDMIRNGSRKKLNFSKKELKADQDYVSIGFYIQKIFPGIGDAQRLLDGEIRNQQSLSFISIHCYDLCSLLHFGSLAVHFGSLAVKLVSSYRLFDLFQKMTEQKRKEPKKLEHNANHLQSITSVLQGFIFHSDIRVAVNCALCIAIAVDWKNYIQKDNWYRLITKEMVMSLVVPGLASKSIMTHNRPAVHIVVSMLELQQVPSWMSAVFDDSCISGIIQNLSPGGGALGGFHNGQVALYSPCYGIRNSDLNWYINSFEISQTMFVDVTFIRTISMEKLNGIDRVYLMLRYLVNPSCGVELAHAKGGANLSILLLSIFLKEQAPAISGALSQYYPQGSYQLVLSLRALVERDSDLSGRIPYEFEMIINRVTGISENLLVSIYIFGLKPALQRALLRSNLTALGGAFSLVRVTEARFAAQGPATTSATPNLKPPTSPILTIGGSQNKASDSSTTPEVAHEVATEVALEVATEVALEVASEAVRETTTAADTVVKIEETGEFYTSESDEHGTKPEEGKSNGVISILKDGGGEFDDSLDEINLGLSEEFVIRVLEGRDVSGEKSREVFSVTPWAAEGERRVLYYVQGSGRRERKKSVGCSSGRRDCALFRASVFPFFNPGPGSFAHKRIWDHRIKIVFKTTP